MEEFVICLVLTNLEYGLVAGCSISVMDNRAKGKRFTKRTFGTQPMQTLSLPIDRRDAVAFDRPACRKCAVRISFNRHDVANRRSGCCNSPRSRLRLHPSQFRYTVSSHA